MEFDRKALNEALASDPAKIEMLARGIAQAMGVPAETALAISRNTDLIRARLASMSDQDLRNAAAMLGPERAAQIMALLKGGNG